MHCKGDDTGNCCGICHLKVVAVMASHNRPEITRKSCNALKEMGMDVLLVISTNSDLEALEDFKPFLFPNSPLGAKWQFAVNEARKLNPDLLVTCGSDDILNSSYLKNAYKIIQKGYDFVGVSQWYMNDLKRNVIFKAWYKHTPDFPVGSGRVYTKAALDKIDWQIFERKSSRRLDDKGYYALNKCNKYVSNDVDKDGLMITAVKGNWEQLNPIEMFFKAPTIGIKKMDI